VSDVAPNRWLMLGLGMLAQAACYLPVIALTFLIPALQAETGLRLAALGLLIGAPSAGMVLMLIAWGWLADRRGERLAMSAGLALTTVMLALAAYADHPGLLAALLVATGAASASGSAASGRVVLGWFPAERRGFAMGVRQTALPLSGVFAGLAIPPIAIAYGVRGALLACALICLVAALLVFAFVVDPPRPARTEMTARSPYRRPELWRIHGASFLLVVPQFATSVFMVAYLVGDRGWSLVAAGQLAALAQLLGAVGRLACGRWSDVVASRIGPMRQLAWAISAAVLALALATQLETAAAVPLLVFAAALSMSGNGLAFTAVAELAGPVWAGRALGTQNTMQNLAAAGTPGLLGLLIVPAGYAAAFAVSGTLALLAAISLTGQGKPASRSGEGL
jgi:sugar phosphate permease